MGNPLNGEESKEVLKAVYLLQLEKGCATIEDVSRMLKQGREWCERKLAELEAGNLVKNVSAGRSSGFVLSDEGRRGLKVVLTGGVFDIVHVGHLATLREAKKLGDVLVVVVARDRTVERMKGRKPINSEENRLEVVSALKPVDIAILGDEEDLYRTVRRVKPDVIALGYDQKHNEEEMRKKLNELGMNTKVVRLKIGIPHVKTSLIISRLQNIGKKSC